ncbi:MAG: ABC transporter ATP-binding protein [Patescibacteria group bacterium]
MNLRRIFRITRLVFRTFRRYHGRFVVLIGLGFAGGIFGGIGITAVIPLFSLFGSEAVVIPDKITNYITSFFLFLHLPLTPSFLLIFIVLLFIVKALIQFLSRYLTDRTMLEFSEEMQRSLFVNTLRASWPHLLNHKVGYLERFILEDTKNVAGILGLIGGSIMLGTSMVMYGVVSLSISVPVTLASAGFGALLFLASKPLFTKTRRITAQRGIMEKTSNHFITESILGMKFIKANHSENSVSSRGKQFFSDVRSLNTRQIFYSYLTSAFTEPIGFIFIAVLFLTSYSKPGFSIVAFGVIMYLIQRVFGFVQSLQGQIQTINSMEPYLRSLVRYRNEVIRNREIDSGSREFSFQRSIVFRDVSFSYEGSRSVLSHVMFEIRKGDMIGVIGPSGAGKTTIVDLLLRLFEPTGGAIVVDDIPLTDIRLSSWRKNIGYVSQEVFLLNDTIENNIRFYDSTITDNMVREAARLAHTSEFVDRLPEGLQTIVGERGVKLSGGQRQRIALARALARKPEILILDEATSNLDAASEALIQKVIFGIQHSVTIVVIAHRLSTIMHADHLIVLQEGIISEQGTPKTLSAQSESYTFRMLRTSEEQSMF